MATQQPTKAPSAYSDPASDDEDSTSQAAPSIEPSDSNGRSRTTRNAPPVHHYAPYYAQAAPLLPAAYSSSSYQSRTAEPPRVAAFEMLTSPPKDDEDDTPFETADPRTQYVAVTPPPQPQMQMSTLGPYYQYYTGMPMQNPTMYPNTGLAFPNMWPVPVPSYAPALGYGVARSADPVPQVMNAAPSTDAVQAQGSGIDQILFQQQSSARNEEEKEVEPNENHVAFFTDEPADAEALYSTTLGHTGARVKPAPPVPDIVDPLTGFKSPDLEAVPESKQPDTATKLRGDKYPSTKPTCSLNLVCYSRGCLIRQVNVTTPDRLTPAQFKAAKQANPKLIHTDEQLFNALRHAYLHSMCGFWRRWFSLKTLKTLRLLEVK
jgi:hypothetical protein